MKSPKLRRLMKLAGFRTLRKPLPKIGLFQSETKNSASNFGSMEIRTSFPLPNDNTNARSKRRDLFELTFVYGLILLVIWTPRSMQPLFWVVAAILTLAIAGFSFEGLERMGIRKLNLLQSLWGIAVALAVALLAVALAARLNTLHVPPSPILFFKHYAGYFVWATIQQLVLQCFFLSRTMRLFEDRTTAVALSASLFAIAHMPNPILTFICWVCGVASCLFFLRYRNLFPVAIAHAILGISIAVTIPGPVDHNMRVGLGYLTYVDKSALVHVVQPPVTNKIVQSPKP